jgi:signal transduction histidine kinase
MRSFMVGAALAATLGAGAALAQDQEYGTPEEAQAMLQEAVAAVESDTDTALASFTAGEAPFKDKDLYVFCGDEAGNFTAHGANDQLVGTSMRDLEDKAGEPLGEKLYSAAAEGEMQQVDYMWPRPGEEEPSQKSSYVTKVADQVCAVGYYQ